MTLSYTQVNLDSIAFAPVDTNRHGGKYASVSYGGSRMGFVLGDETTFSRVAFEPGKFEQSSDKWGMKIELSGEPERFMRNLEAKVMEAGVANKETWFKRGLFVPSDDAVKSQFMSKLTESTNPTFPDPTYRFGVHPSGDKATEVLIAPSMEELSKAAPGSLDDIKRGMAVLPVLRTAGTRTSPPSACPLPRSSSSPVQHSVLAAPQLRTACLDNISLPSLTPCTLACARWRLVFCRRLWHLV